MSRFKWIVVSKTAEDAVVVQFAAPETHSGKYVQSLGEFPLTLYLDADDRIATIVIPWAKSMLPPIAGNKRDPLGIPMTRMTDDFALEFGLHEGWERHVHTDRPVRLSSERSFSLLLSGAERLVGFRFPHPVATYLPNIPPGMPEPPQ